jgi:hypothetical protein
MERPTRERLEKIRAKRAEVCLIEYSDVEELFSEIDALTVERDAAFAASEINFATAKRREREALRWGFDAAQRWNYDENRPEFPTWEHLESHLAEEEEHAARLIRSAEAEEREKSPDDTQIG